MAEELTCLNRGPECAGPVEYRPTPPYGERALPRCEHHDEARWASYNDENSIERYAASSPGVRPSWFDEGYAGEHWDEDDY